MPEGEKRFLGNYRLLHALGQGGFAEVYLAEHMYLQTQVAIKLLRLRIFEDDQERFLQEAQLVAHLVHPHIIRVFEFGVEQGTPFLVMSYAPHGTLRQQHPAGSQISLDHTVASIKQVASAIQYAHDHQIIHRDIKPENMLLGSKGEILLSDFGIALMARSSTSQSLHDVMGTVTYMAPEQLLGKPRPASDQYALAIVAYELLTGRVPFKGTDYIEVANKHLTLPPPPLRQFLPTLPAQVEAVILKALAKDSHQRFESVQAFADALADTSIPALSVMSLPTHPLPATLPFPHSTRPDKALPRRTILTGLATLTGLAVFSGGIIWFTSSQRTYPNVSAAKIIPSTFSPSTILPTPKPALIRSLLIYRGHSAAVDTVAWSPDGQRVASGSADQTIQIWNAFDGTNVLRQTNVFGSGDGQRYLAWQPHQKLIAFFTLDAFVHLYNTINGTVLRSYPLWDASSALAWSVDGKYLAAAGGEYVNRRS